eukprot:3744454-Amphidinium_carterae.1
MKFPNSSADVPCTISDHIKMVANSTHRYAVHYALRSEAGLYTSMVKDIAPPVIFLDDEHADHLSELIQANLYCA